MLFNSYEFALFAPIAFLLYWFVFQRNLKVQNFYLLVISYIFYGWWDWRFLGLIFFSSGVDYLIGLTIDKSTNPIRRKALLILSLSVNLGLLGVFKYYNFFLESFIELFANFGIHLQGSTINIILPVGISFYTFQTLSYTIDIYRRKLAPSKDVVSFFAFVSFFPQLVAGPIERAANLLPQFSKPRKFNYLSSVDGMRQILWGLFKKIVVADNCAILVNDIFANSESYNPSVLFIGAVLFAFQIYGDFSGYSDIAIGIARLFGFDLMRNFAFPYFSRDIAEFWRRWHISLSTWFRDYLYIPLGGSRGTLGKTVFNTFLIFVVSGFWHGANWTFIVWGAMHAIFFLPLLLRKANRKNIEIVKKGKLYPSFKEVLQILFTFGLVLVSWVVFRADNISQAFHYTLDMLSFHQWQMPNIDFLKPFAFISILIAVEWINRDKEFGLDLSLVRNTYIRRAIYLAVFWLIFFFGAAQQEFIYFQF